jgi:hypothetical protein
MTLKLEQHQALRTFARRGDPPPRAAFVQLVRDSYPELWKQLHQILQHNTESIGIEPGDVVQVADNYCVMQRDPLLRRRIMRRDEEARELEAEQHKQDGVEAPAEIWKEFDAPRNGIATVVWDRAYWGQTQADEQRSGRIEITAYEPLGTASREIHLRQPSDTVRWELAEVFATRSIPLALNTFFGIRVFLASPDTILLARPDLHATDRLQELLRNPTERESEHLLSDFPTKHPDAYRFFQSMRDEAYQKSERRVERNLSGLPRALCLELLTAVAVPQIHGTLGNLLRMQFAFLQPNTMVGSTLVSAGASLQLAWDATVQLRILEASFE